jgi:hypothetical protein
MNAPFEAVIVTRIPLDVTSREVADTLAHDIADDMARSAGQYGLYEPQIERCDVECTAAWAAGEVL